jgi:hypothetical protein
MSGNYLEKKIMDAINKEMIAHLRVEHTDGIVASNLDGFAAVAGVIIDGMSKDEFESVGSRLVSALSSDCCSNAAQANRYYRRGALRGYL